MNHFLTFILPCYNYADIIEQSLDSIYQQNLKIPFEVIATDDVSPDERTREILRKWDKKYDNFRFGSSERGNTRKLQRLGIAHWRTCARPWNYSKIERRGLLRN